MPNIYRRFTPNRSAHHHHPPPFSDISYDYLHILSLQPPANERRLLFPNFSCSSTSLAFTIHYEYCAKGARRHHHLWRPQHPQVSLSLKVYERWRSAWLKEMEKFNQLAALLSLFLPKSGHKNRTIRMSHVMSDYHTSLGFFFVSGGGRWWSSLSLTLHAPLAKNPECFPWIIHEKNFAGGGAGGPRKNSIQISSICLRDDDWASRNRRTEIKRQWMK